MKNHTQFFPQLFTRIATISTFALMLALTGCGMAQRAGEDTTAAVQAPLPQIVVDYFAGWNASDSARVLATFTSDGVYIDPQVPNGLRGTEMMVYIDQFKGFKVKTPSYRFLADGSPEVLWELFDPSGKLIAKGKDVMAISNGKLARVVGSW
ncbi:MAG: nuclear transport factor 2 family protein [Pseudomonadota bacterium]